MKLDRTKPFGIAFIGPNSYYGQGSRLFDKRTEEEVIQPVTTPSPDAPKTPEPVADPDKVKCKFCEKEFTLPKNPTARRFALGKLRTHLQKEHGVTVEDKTK